MTSSEFIEDKKQSKVRNIVVNSIVIFLIIVLVVMICLKIFVFQRFEINQSSMEPNFHDGQSIWINKCAKFSYNDVIVLERSDQKYIKRVVAFGGDMVEIKKNSYGDYKLFLKKKGTNIFIEQQESFILEDMLSSCSFDEKIVPEGHCFVLGDNRNNSVDSRIFGFLKIDDVIGKVI